jgi:hypothetical protein
MLWMHSEHEGKRGEMAPRQLSGRGLAYWTDGKEERILYVTPGYRLIALNAKTGAIVTGFGRGGVVDLKQDFDQEVDLINGDVGLHATPIVAKDIVIVGAAHLSGMAPVSRKNVKGYVRGFDVRTGKRIWTFHTIPRPGEFGLDTWEKDSWSYTGNTGVWGQMSVDEELGMVYLGVELPTGDYYGGHRPGNGLFGESLVALDLQTGKRKWHYQFIHHGIWDMDVPCAPILTNITVNGRTIKAVAQPTKQSFLYVFDRVTGQPIWPIEERPVEKGDVPGEWYSPTQPFPTKPPAYHRQGVSIDGLIDFTPQLRAEAEKLVALSDLVAVDVVTDEVHVVGVAERAGARDGRAHLVDVTVVSRAQQRLLVGAESVGEADTRGERVPLQIARVAGEAERRKRETEVATRAERVSASELRGAEDADRSADDALRSHRVHRFEPGKNVHVEAKQTRDIAQNELQCEDDFG